jgi:hypothetical protein
MLVGLGEGSEERRLGVDWRGRFDARRIVRRRVLGKLVREDALHSGEHLGFRERVLAVRKLLGTMRMIWIY